MNNLIIQDEQPLAPFAYAPSRHPAIVYVNSLSFKSQRPMNDALFRIARFLGMPDAIQCPWHLLEHQHISSVRAWLASSYSAASANRMLAALRGVIKECWRFKYITAEQRALLTDFDPVRGSTFDAAAGRALSNDEMEKIFEVCRKQNKKKWGERTLIDVRDTAIIALLYGGGLRRSEMVTLDTKHYDKETGYITIKGKGNKTRKNPLHPYIREDIDTWLSIRESYAPLFYRIRKGGQMTGERLTDQSIYYIVKKRAALAKIETFTPHDMRRTFAGNLMDTGSDISAVSILMGHSNVNTTIKYDRRGERAKVAAIESQVIPGRPKSAEAIEAESIEE